MRSVIADYKHVPKWLKWLPGSIFGLWLSVSAFQNGSVARALLVLWIPLLILFLLWPVRLRGVRLYLVVAALVALGSTGGYFLWQPTADPAISILNQLVRKVEDFGKKQDALIASGVRTKFDKQQVVQAISKGGSCPCKDEVDLGAVGILYILDAGRNYVEMAFTDQPSVVLRDPQPGKVDIPHEPLKPSGPATEPDTEPPQIAITNITIPPGGPGGTLKIRDLKSRARFDAGGTREHQFVATGRTFLVTLRDYGEAPTFDRQHTIYSYTFNVVEQ